jgi:glutamine synthetase
MKPRSAVRGAALSHGYRASLGQTVPQTFGSGAHVHLSIWDDEGCRDLTYDPRCPEGFSQLGRQFIGGILHHVPGLIALTCPSFN